MTRCLLLIIALLPMAACSNSRPPVAPDAVPTASQTSGVLASDIRAETSTQNEFVPLSVSVWVECAAGGSGELVQLEGNLHVLSHVTRDAASGFHISQHYQPQGVRGTGAATGDRYQGTGVTRWNTNLEAGVSHTYVNTFRIIGQKAGNNHLVHETYHVTVNAGGRVTTERFRLSVDCK